MASSSEVAKHAGVSQTTVSRVLNNPSKVKAETVEKVMAAVAELNYKPGNQGRPAIQKKSGKIALIAGPADDPFFAETTQSIITYANQHDFKVDVHHVTAWNFEETVSDSIKNNVDGLIVSASFVNTDALNKLNRSGIPCIRFNRNPQSSNQFVEMDNLEAGFLAAMYLLNGKHKQIAWVGGPMNEAVNKERFTGYVHAFQQMNKKIKNKKIFISEMDEAALAQIFFEMENAKKKPTAIVAATDAIALQLMDLYLEAGYSIPEDISIIGIDNVKLSGHHAIGLTSVGNESNDSLGQLAIEKLIFSIQNPNELKTQITKAVKVYERNTVKSLQ